MRSLLPKKRQSRNRRQSRKRRMPKIRHRFFLTRRNQRRRQGRGGGHLTKPENRPWWNEEHSVSVSFLSWEVHEGLRLQAQPSEECLHNRTEEEVRGRSSRRTPQERWHLLLLEEGACKKGKGCKFKHPKNSAPLEKDSDAESEADSEKKTQKQKAKAAPVISTGSL